MTRSARADCARSSATSASPARRRPQQKVTILIEPLNPRDMPRYLFSTQADAHAIREELALPNLRVQMDLYHAQIVEGDLTVKIRKWLPHIGHFQIAGVPSRGEPNIGELNYEYFFKLLDELEVRRLDRLRVPAGAVDHRRAGLALPVDRSAADWRDQL